MTTDFRALCAELAGLTDAQVDRAADLLERLALQPPKVMHSLQSENKDGETLVVSVYSSFKMANRAKELCPGSYITALPFDYIPKGCPEGKQAYRVNVDCGDGSICTEQIDVFILEGEFTSTEHYWLYPFEQRAGEMCLELWANDKWDAEVIARCAYEQFKGSFPDNCRSVFSSDEWEALLRDGELSRVRQC